MSLPLPLEELQDGPSFLSFDTEITHYSEFVPGLSCCGSCICSCWRWYQIIPKCYWIRQPFSARRVPKGFVSSAKHQLMPSHHSCHTAPPAKWCRPILCRISSSLCVLNWNSQCQACSALLDILSSTASLSPLHAPKQSVAPLFHKNTMGLRTAFPYRGMQYVAILSSLRTAMFSSVIMSS